MRPYEVEALLEQACHSESPTQEGMCRADTIAECPPDNRGWAEHGVAEDYHRNTFWTIALSIIAGAIRNSGEDDATNAMRNSAIAIAMTERLRQYPNLHERLTSDMIPVIVIRACNAPTDSTGDQPVSPARVPAAVTHIAGWALELTPDQNSDALHKALLLNLDSAAYIPRQLRALVPELSAMGYSTAASRLDRAMQAHQQLSDRRIDERTAARQAADLRAVQDAAARAREERRSTIAARPIQMLNEALGLYASTVGVDDLVPLIRFPEVLTIANVIMAQTETDDLPMDAHDQSEVDTINLAQRLLDKAVELRSVFSIPFNEMDSQELDAHEERQVVMADSVQEFWKWYALLSRSRTIPLNAPNLYERWRRRFIMNQQQNASKNALQENSIDPDSFIPEGFHSITISAPGSIAYSSIETLINDLRRYFTPYTSDFTGLDGTDGLAGLSGNEPGTNVNYEFAYSCCVAALNNLIHELENWWAEQTRSFGQPDTKNVFMYRPNNNDYTAEGNFLGRHKIDIAYATDRRLTLDVRDDSDQVRHPIDRAIHRFAAYTGRKITHGGPILITCVNQPPARNDMHTRAIALPIGSALRHIQTLTGLDDASIATLLNRAATGTSVWNAQPVQSNGISVRIGTIGLRPGHDNAWSPDGQTLLGYARTLQFLQEEEYGFNPGQLLVAIDSSERPASLGVLGSVGLGRALSAAGVITVTRYKRYPHGRISDDSNIFYVTAVEP